MENQKSNRKPFTELYLIKNQIEGIMYVLDSYINADKNHKCGQFAERMKQKILNHSRTFISNKEEMASLLMYETDMVIMVKLFSTYISAVQEMPKDFFAEVVEAQRARAIESLNH